MDTFLFTSESVNKGHPDKLCDQISAAVPDACLAQDADSKVACKTWTLTNMVKVFSAENCKVVVNIEQQSPDIAQGVHGHLTKHPEEIGAGETPELMPLSHVLATKLGARLTEVRKNETCPWLTPDGRTQVTVEYQKDKGAMVPIGVHNVLISTQHNETVTNDKIAADLKEYDGDAGLTGRKIIIDTYDGWGAHGGGAFSGKDPTTSIGPNGLARRGIVQVSYAIGVPEPLSVHVDTDGTGKIPDKEIRDKEILKTVKETLKILKELFGLIAIILGLKRAFWT